MEGARRAVIQPAPGSACSWPIRTLVTDPRSPTKMTSSSPNLSLTTGMISPKATESEVLPGKTRTATGIPARLVTMPNSICSRFFFPSRECPNAPSGQLCPSSHADDKSNNARPPASRCRAASFFSIASCRDSSQSIAAYTSSVLAPSIPRPAPRVVSAHQRVVASFDAGATARAIISPYARSRSGQSGPKSFFSPSRDAITCAAATCPCGNDRSISNISPASRVHQHRPGQRGLQRRDRAVGKRRQIRQRFFSHFPAVAVGAAQQMRPVGPCLAVAGPVGLCRALDVHPRMPWVVHEIIIAAQTHDV